MNDFATMISGAIYNPAAAELKTLRAEARAKLDRFNHTLSHEHELRSAIISELFGTVGDNPFVNLNFRCDYGKNIHVGANFYTNYGCVILDCAPVIIGDNCLIGPQVGIYTACHPLDPIERASGQEFAKPIHMGDNCWIGGHATINPGVTLGNNVVVGAGAVVTKSFGDNVVIAGNPAKVIKVIRPATHLADSQPDPLLD